MDTSSIAGSALLMQTAQSQQAMSTSIMKLAADQQNQMATLLAQNAKQIPQPVPQSSGFTFSIYA
jgi:hypothetical protein